MKNFFGNEEEFEPGKKFYNIPKNMTAYAVIKDRPKSFELIEVEVPKIGVDEALVCVKAAALNYNTIWTIDGSPISTFDFLKRLRTVSNTEEDHNRNFHIPGSDASGFIVKLGNKDTKWTIGSEVVINCNWHRNDDPNIYSDSLHSKEQKIWGYETNFGSLAPFTVVKIHQLMKKPSHLSWFEAASYCLVLSTAYRMLVSKNGAQIKAGDSVLVWGGTGGLGLSAIQLINLSGAKPMPVVSSTEKSDFLEGIGEKNYIDRKKEKLQFFINEKHNMVEWKRLENLLVKRFGNKPNVVFEHPGRETMAASIFALEKGGSVVTCAATTGYDIEYDNRFLWMESKSIIGCHFANPMESFLSNQLMIDKKVSPFVSSVFDFENVPEAVLKFRLNEGLGKIVIGVTASTNSDNIKSEYNLFKKVSINE